LKVGHIRGLATSFKMRPLEGVVVLELAVAIAGPACAGVLADWGASVQKVEMPDDRSRDQYAGLPVNKAKPEQLSPLVFLDSRGKSSIVLNLKEVDDRAAFELLLSSADVFVSNLREQALFRLDLAPEQILKRHPRIVIARITGYGRSYGPDKDLPAYEPTAAWARGGLAESHRSYGYEYPPMLTGGLADHATGALAAGGVAAALLKASKTGKGRVCEW
jgi:crotonobetainyl-CoA:carnitine CoA-transferase CaiB-like acyl-CoA transferase